MARRRFAVAVQSRYIPFPEYPCIVNMLEGRATGPHTSDRHSHPWCEINILLEGRGTWHVADQPLQVSANDAVLLMPQTPHYAEWPSGVRFRTATLTFMLGPESQSFGFHDSGLEPAPPRSEATHWLWEVLARKPFHRLTHEGLADRWRRLAEEANGVSSPYRGLRAEAAMLDLLARFADPAPGAVDWEHADRRGIERALRMIGENLTAGNASITELARVAGMSRSKFAALFHRTLGMPPHAYAIALRVWMAQSALSGSRASAATISEWLGFTSPQHFTRAFRNVAGITPRQYRRRWAASWLKKRPSAST